MKVRRKADRFAVSLSVFVFLSVFVLLCGAPPLLGQERSGVERREAEQIRESFAVIETANYSARFEEGDLVDGTLEWSVLRHGAGPAILELSDAQVAIHNLRGAQQPVVWGTTDNNSQVVLVSDTELQLQGEWSQHGHQILGRSLIECRLPDAVNSVMTLEIPHGYEVLANVGLSQRIGINEDFAIWKIDLGRNHHVVLQIIAPSPSADAPRLCDTQTVYVVRRDGLFVQCDFTIYQLRPDARNIRIETGGELVVQSISTLGVPLEFTQTGPGAATLVDIPDGATADRLSVRVQATGPFELGTFRDLPKMIAANSVEQQREATIRIESPLEILDLSFPGYLQTGLTSEPGSDLWRFQSFDPESRISLNVAEPEQSLNLKVSSLINLDTPLPWSLSQLELQTESGSLQTVDVQVPNGWEIAGVFAESQNSELNSWVHEAQVLKLQFRQPIAPGTNRRVTIFARCRHPFEGQADVLPVLMNASGRTTEVELDWVLPANVEIELPENSSWKRESAVSNRENKYRLPIDEAVLADREVVRLSHRQPWRNLLQPFRIVKPTSPVKQAFPDDALTWDDSEGVPASVAENDNVFAEMSLTTQGERTGDRGRMQLVHHARIHLSRPVPLQILQLRLDPICRISAVSVDGQFVKIFTTEESIQFPREPVLATDIELVYITDAELQLLQQRIQIAIPQLNLSTGGFEWELNLPNGLELSDLRLPGYRPVPQVNRYFFGPLTGWNSVMHSDVGIGEKSVWHSPRMGSEITFTAWDYHLSRNIAWSALFLCALLGLSPRLQALRWIRYWAPLWVLLLVSVQVYMTNQWSLIVGGMLAGSVVTSLLPIRLSLPEWKWRNASHALAATGVAGLWIVMLCNSNVANGQFSGSARPHLLNSHFANADLTSLPEVLIQSADYEVMQLNPVQLIRAKLKVWVRRSGTDVAVPLRYRNVVFSAGATCIVDGHEEPLLPHASGEGVVVLIGSASSRTSASEVHEWSQHLIELTFSNEWSTQIAEPESVPQIPRVLETRLVIPGQVERHEITRFGRIEELIDESFTVQLGPVLEIRIQPGDHKSHTPILQSYSMLTMTPMGIEGEMTIVGLDGLADRFITLTVPDRVRVQSVSGTSFVRWYPSFSDSGDESIIVDRGSTVAEKTMNVRFFIPSQNSQHAVIPEWRWSPLLAYQIVGVQSPVSVGLKLEESAPTVSQAENVKALNDQFPRARPQFVLDVSSPVEIDVWFAKIAHQVMTSSRDVLTIREESTEWEANLEITTETIPEFMHRLQLNTDVTIRAVYDGNQPGQVPLRFRQSGRQITVLVPEGQIGRRSLLLQGTLATVPGGWLDIPVIKLAGSDSAPRTLTVIDYTNWQLDLAANETIVQSETPIPNADPLHPRVITDSAMTADENWTRIRITPPEGDLQVESVVRWLSAQRGPQRLQHLLRFSWNQTPARQVKLVIPKSYGRFRLFPTGQSSLVEQTDQGTTVEYSIPENSSQPFRMSVVTEIPEDVMELASGRLDDSKTVQFPNFLVNDQPITAKLFLVEESAPVIVSTVSGVAIPSQELPNWLDPKLREAVQSGELIAFQQVQDVAEFRRKPSVSIADNPTVSYAETIIWPSEHGSQISAVTQLWLVPNGHRQFRFSSSPQVEIVSIDAGTLPDGSGEIASGETLIELPPNEPVATCEVQWSGPVEADGIIRFPFTELIGVPHLVGIMRTQQQAVSDSQSLTQFEGMVARMNALVDLAEGVNSPLPIESSLMLTLQQTLHAIRSWQQKHTLTAPQMDALRQVESRWEAMSQSIVVTSEVNIRRRDAVQLSVIDVLTSPTGARQVDWLRDDQVDALRLAARPHDQYAWIAQLSALALFPVGFILLVWKRKWLSRIVEFHEKYPEIGLLVLTGLWVTCLTPPVMGWFAFCIAGVYFIRRGKRLRPVDEIPSISAT